MYKNAQNLLVCPVCNSSLTFEEEKIACSNGSCKRMFKMNGSIFDFSDFNSLDPDFRLSINKWDDFYRTEIAKKSYNDLYDVYIKNNYKNVYSQIKQYKKFTNELTFLEIGCGPMVLGRALANKCKLIVGVDFSIEALKIAEKMFKENNIENYLLILGDIRRMPLRSNCIDVVYGGGVIEHFKDTLGSLKESYRVLKINGISFNTVPHLNIGSLTYRQVWGNIPNFPVLKELAEFVHINLLKAKHMRFGYEFSFLGSHLKVLHKKAGFRKVVVKKFDTELEFEFIPWKKMRTYLIRLANSSPLFWPMIKVIGIK